jgi:hypothetical protein
MPLVITFSDWVTAGKFVEFDFWGGGGIGIRRASSAAS